MRKIFLLIIYLSTVLGVHAQSFTVTGKIIDNEGLEVIGANITVKGSAGIGTITNIDGQYSLKINNPTKDILIFSYIGMRAQEVAVKGQKQINITLHPDNLVLDEVVVTGYQQIEKRKVTSAITTVQADDIKSIGVARRSDANPNF